MSKRRKCKVKGQHIGKEITGRSSLTQSIRGGERVTKIAPHPLPVPTRGEALRTKSAKIGKARERKTIHTTVRQKTEIKGCRPGGEKGAGVKLGVLDQTRDGDNVKT